MELWGIITKEFKHIFRDLRTLLILIVMPVLMLVLFGYAMSLELQNIDIRIQDNDDSPQSRILMEKFRASTLFSLVDTDESPHLLFQKNRIQVYMTIPDDFASSIYQGQAVYLDIIIDGSDSSKAVIIRQYIASVLMSFSAERSSASLPVSIQPVYLYNPDLNSAFFFVPGLTALLIIMVSALLTSLTIAREKESGTFALIKLSSTRSYQVIIGKVLPYLVLSFLISLLVISSGRILFRVPVRGNIFLLFFYLLMYCLTGLSFGILISTLVKTQQSAMLIAMIATLLPTLFLSGFVFPLESMPKPIYWLSHIVPARYFLVLIRGLMLKGNSFGDLIQPMLILGLFSLLFLLVAVRRFKKYLED